MGERENLSSSKVATIDENERSDLVSYRESTKLFHIKRTMSVISNYAAAQHHHTQFLHISSQLTQEPLPVIGPRSGHIYGN